MGEYRYLVFPAGAVPTGDELRAFHAAAQRAGLRVAHGKRKPDGALALVFEAEALDRSVGLGDSLDNVLLKWRVRGAELSSQVPFARDAEAWRSLEHADSAPPAAVHARRNHTSDRVAPNAIDGREATALARLAVVRSGQTAERLRRFAELGPYALLGLGAALVLGAGLYIGSHLTGLDIERRRDTVDRVAIDAAETGLSTRKKSNPTPAEANTLANETRSVP